MQGRGAVCRAARASRTRKTREWHPVQRNRSACTGTGDEHWQAIWSAAGGGGGPGTSTGRPMAGAGESVELRWFSRRHDWRHPSRPAREGRRLGTYSGRQGGRPGSTAGSKAGTGTRIWACGSREARGAIPARHGRLGWRSRSGSWSGLTSGRRIAQGKHGSVTCASARTDTRRVRPQDAGGAGTGDESATVEGPRLRVRPLEGYKKGAQR